jgi:ribosomal protein S18 acetylase RimI-like enzyme
MGPGDDERVTAAAHLFDDAPKPAALSRFLADPTHHLLIAYSAEVPAGFVSGVEVTHPDKGTEMFLYELAVDPSHQRQGIGTGLVTALRDLAAQKGCYDMWVLTDDDNKPALNTYRKSGTMESSSHVMLTWRFANKPKG